MTAYSIFLIFLSIFAFLIVVSGFYFQIRQIVLERLISVEAKLSAVNSVKEMQAIMLKSQKLFQIAITLGFDKKVAGISDTCNIRAFTLRRKETDLH